MAVVSALSFLQCFGTIGWVTGGRLACEKPLPIIAKGCVLKQLLHPFNGLFPDQPAGTRTVSHSGFYGSKR